MEAGGAAAGALGLGDAVHELAPRLAIGAADESAIHGFGTSTATRPLLSKAPASSIQGPASISGWAAPAGVEPRPGGTRMEPLHVLVVDLTHTSAFFLRSLLRAEGARVSIALTGREAMEKAATGLFDLFLLDAHPLEAETGALVAGLRELLPAIPALLVTDLPEGQPWTLPPVWHVVRKPLRLTELRTSLARAHRHLARLREQRRHVRRAVDLPVELAVGARRVPARALNLSLGGVQVDTTDGDAWRILALAGGELRARLALGGDGAALELPARLAYVEGQDGAPSQVGLAFGSVATSVREQLRRFLTAA